MRSRLVLALFISFFMTVVMAETNNEKLPKAVFELERSVAILQLSKSNLEDYQTMDDKVASLEKTVYFLGTLTLLLSIGFVVFFLHLRRQQKRLLLLENLSSKPHSSEVNDRLNHE